MIQLKTAPAVLMNDLSAVETALVAYCKQQPGIVGEGLMSLVKSGGKRIRPLLCLIGLHYKHSVVSPEEAQRQQMIELASIPELIHLASLIHDDIVDQAETRRGVKTLHQQFGTHAAVYAGDLVIIDTLNRLLEHYDKAAYKQFCGDLTQLVRAEMLQMANKEAKSLSIKQYLRAIEGKTARLLKLSLEMGLVYQHVDLRTRKSLVKVVHAMGMAFQIIDDCLDFSADQAALGKPLFQDLKNGYMTLPAILHCRRNPDFYQKIKRTNGLRWQKLNPEIFKPDLEEALGVAERYHKRAKQILKTLPDNPMHAPLLELMDLLLTRNF